MTSVGMVINAEKCKFKTSMTMDYVLLDWPRNWSKTWVVRNTGGLEAPDGTFGEPWEPQRGPMSQLSSVFHKVPNSDTINICWQGSSLQVIRWTWDTSFTHVQTLTCRVMTLLMLIVNKYYNGCPMACLVSQMSSRRSWRWTNLDRICKGSTNRLSLHFSGLRSRRSRAFLLDNALM